MLYFLVRGVLRLYFSLCKGWVVEGVENIPQAGGLIVVANHTSYWDPPILGAAMTRQVNIMAKVELFRYPLFGSILRLLGAFPVKRNAVDRSAIKQALAILKEDKVLGMFPEGTRSKTGRLGKAQPGVVLFATKSGAPILPAGIIMGKGRKGLVVKFGKPFFLTAESREREEAGKRIMAEIASLLN
ncbi:MAG TPA: 1-acyl-sn-glycerol-3-phosphate acyltransferase [Firmicutes bacterium]|jgi:1-acyl-sn-glycerol-3-phosphate acyltransferase|nr:1-acyl-sn-glycerol-3-phosphate acyltransferase [Bacillota bacterium]